MSSYNVRWWSSENLHIFSFNGGIEAVGQMRPKLLLWFPDILVVRDFGPHTRLV